MDPVDPPKFLKKGKLAAPLISKEWVYPGRPFRVDPPETSYVNITGLGSPGSHLAEVLFREPTIRTPTRKHRHTPGTFIFNARVILGLLG